MWREHDEEGGEILKVGRNPKTNIQGKKQWKQVWTEKQIHTSAWVGIEPVPIKVNSMDEESTTAV